MFLLLIERYNFVDERLSFYMPFYLIGLLLPNRVTTFIKDHCLFIFSLLSFLLAGIFLIEDKSLTRILLSIIGFPLFLSVSSILVKVTMIRKVSSIISYSSMCMYFFHRHIYLAIVLLWNVGNPTVSLKEATIPICLGICVACPLVIISSYMIQQLYDKYSKNVFG